jgi:uncharacterized protein with HEPN domain
MKDNNIYLKNILDKAREAGHYCDNLPLEAFLKNDLVQSAVILKLIVVGEEAKKLSEAITSNIDLPWRKIIGFRNMAVHEYFDIDPAQIWNTVKTDLPDMITKIETYFSKN